MKNLFITLGLIISIGLFGGGIYMAINEITNWGWLMVVGVIIVGTCYDVIFVNKKSD